MKYVILKGVDKINVTRVFPIIFPETLTHSEVAKSMRHMIGFDRDFIPEVFSAGFCDIDVDAGEFECERGSESLKIPKGTNDERLGDKKILNMPSAMQGILL